MFSLIGFEDAEREVEGVFERSHSFIVIIMHEHAAHGRGSTLPVEPQ